MANFESSVGDASVATPRVESLGSLHTEVRQLQQSSIQDKKTGPKEPESGFLDLSSDVYGTKPVDKKNSESTAQTHKITPEEYKKMAEDKQAIARKMEGHVFTPEELKNQELKRQQLDNANGKLQIIGGPDSPGARLQEKLKEGKGEKEAGEKGTKDGGKSAKELTPEQWEKLKAMKQAAEKEGTKGEPADKKLTPEQWEKLRQMKLDAEAAHGKGNAGKPVDANGNEKKPTAGNKPEGKPDQIKPDGNKPHGDPAVKPEGKPDGKPNGKPESKPHALSPDAEEARAVKPWNIDPGHSKPKPTEKPPTPKAGG